jgi:hypothetical protein
MNNVLNVMNHDPTQPTLQGCIGIFGRSEGLEKVQAPSKKVPNGAPRVLGTADRCVMLNLGGFALVRSRRLDPANNVIQCMKSGANTKKLVCFAGIFVARNL